MDAISLKRADTAHPILRDELKRILQEIQALLPVGFTVRYTHVFRSIAEQDALFAQGRTTEGKIVTKAKGGSSYHNYGLAVDVVILKNGQPDWLNKNEFNIAVAVFEKYGWEWGGRWTSFPDAPHFQKTFGNNIAKLKTLKTKQGYPVL